MKTLTVVLLVVTLCMERASSLHCYICENVKSHDECRSVRCSDHDVFINKWCSDTCPTQFEGAIKGGDEILRTDCCQEDNCNTGGSVSVKSSYAVMGMATLASFFYVLRTGL
ncbi:lymphocyte antigen 6E-like [Tiliqua scincoides]|uniref:lymphocyte antigen 6E-like n=1 Tax=Tiliqua scincoides TaxID=71010 RepID=UPI00346298B1